MMSIEEKRRELFERYANEQRWTIAPKQDRLRGILEPRQYQSPATQMAWEGFNAALDAVVIEFVEEYEATETGEHAQQVALVADCMLDDCRAAIESTGLGLKVKS